jgi:hypothetical protein
MPLNSDPNSSSPFVLRIDRDKPADSKPQPVFLVKCLTESERCAAQEQVDRIGKIKDDAAAKQELEKFLRAYVRELRHMDVHGQPVTLESLKVFSDLLTRREQWELAYGIISATELSEEERLGLPSQPASGPGPSAEAAAPPSA